MPHVDFYIAGFPCQPFPTEGLRLGTADERGLLMFAALSYVMAKAPALVVLGNTPDILKAHKEFFDVLVYLLEELDYVVCWDVLDTCDSGLPQRRSRLYIIAIQRCYMVAETCVGHLHWELVYLCHPCSHRFQKRNGGANQKKKGGKIAYDNVELHLTKLRSAGVDVF